MFAQFVQSYHESPASTPSKPQQPAVAPPAPLLVSFDDQRTGAADAAGSGNFRPVSPKSPGSESGGGFVRAISLQGVPVSPLPSRLSPKEAVVPTGAVAAVTARLPGLRGQSDWIGIRAYAPDSCQAQLRVRAQARPAFALQTALICLPFSSEQVYRIIPRDGLGWRTRTVSSATSKTHNRSQYASLPLSFFS